MGLEFNMLANSGKNNLERIKPLKMEVHEVKERGFEAIYKKQSDLVSPKEESKANESANTVELRNMDLQNKKRIEEASLKESQRKEEFVEEEEPYYIGEVNHQSEVTLESDAEDSTSAVSDDLVALKELQEGLGEELSELDKKVVEFLSEIEDVAEEINPKELLEKWNKFLESHSELIEKAGGKTPLMNKLEQLIHSMDINLKNTEYAKQNTIEGLRDEEKDSSEGEVFEESEDEPSLSLVEKNKGEGVKGDGLYNSSNENKMIKGDAALKEAFLDSNKSAKGESPHMTRVMEEKILTQVQSGLLSVVNKSAKSISIQLVPEHLGRMEISLEMKNDLLTGTIKVESESVKSVVEAQLSQLSESLELKNIRLEALQVSVGTQSSFLSERELWNARQAASNGKMGGQKGKSKGEDELIESIELGIDTGRRLGYNTLELMA